MPLKGFFDVLKSILAKDKTILDNTKEVDEVTDQGSWWVLDRYLSMVPGRGTAIIINLLQKYGTVLSKMEYIRLLYFNIPKMGNQFIKYMKKVKTESSTLEELAIPMLREHYKCSNIQAHEYFFLLNESQLGEIAKMYGEKHSKLVDFLFPEKKRGKKK
jgi:hypothetical protein